jgi:hypothetical protein
LLGGVSRTTTLTWQLPTTIAFENEVPVTVNFARREGRCAQG